MEFRALAAIRTGCEHGRSVDDADMDAVRAALQSDIAGVKTEGVRASVTICLHQPEWIPEIIDAVLEAKNDQEGLQHSDLTLVEAITEIQPRATVSLVHPLVETITGFGNAVAPASILGRIGSQYPSLIGEELAAMATVADKEISEGPTSNSVTELLWTIRRTIEADPSIGRPVIATCIHQIDASDRSSAPLFKILGVLGWVCPRRIVGIDRLRDGITSNETDTKRSAFRAVGRIGGRPQTVDRAVGFRGIDVVDSVAEMVLYTRPFQDGSQAIAAAQIGRAVESQHHKRTLAEAYNSQLLTLSDEIGPVNRWGDGDSDGGLDSLYAESDERLELSSSLIEALDWLTESDRSLLEYTADALVSLSAVDEWTLRRDSIRLLGQLPTRYHDASTRNALMNACLDSDHDVAQESRTVLQSTTLPIPRCKVNALCLMVLNHEGEEETHTERRLRALPALCSNAPGALPHVHRTLRRFVDHKNRDFRLAALDALADLGVEFPNQIPEILDILTDRLKWVADDRETIGESIVRLAETHPEATSSALPAMVSYASLPESERASGVEVTGDSLGDLFGDGGSTSNSHLLSFVKATSSALSTVPENLVSLALDGDKETNANAATALRLIAQASPSVVEPWADRLYEWLNASDSGDQTSKIAAVVAFAGDKRQRSMALDRLTQTYFERQTVVAGTALTKIVTRHPHSSATAFTPLLQESYSFENTSRDTGFGEFVPSNNQLDEDEAAAAFVAAHPRYGLAFLAAHRRASWIDRTTNGKLLRTFVDRYPAGASAVAEAVIHNAEQGVDNCRLATLEAFEMADTPRTRQFIEELREHPHPETRRQAIQSLGQRPLTVTPDQPTPSLTPPPATSSKSHSDLSLNEHPSLSNVDATARLLSLASPAFAQELLQGLEQVSDESDDHRRVIVGHLLVQLVGTHDDIARRATLSTMESLAPLDQTDDTGATNRLSRLLALLEGFTDDTDPVIRAQIASTVACLLEGPTEVEQRSLGTAVDLSSIHEGLVNIALSLVEDADPIVRERATRALGAAESSDQRLMELLEERLSDTPQVAAAACETLGRLGARWESSSTAIIDLLIDELTHPSRTVRREAAQAIELTVVHEAQVEQQLAGRLLDRAETDEAAADALAGALGTVPIQTLASEPNAARTLYILLERVETDRGIAAAGTALKQLAELKPSAVSTLVGESLVDETFSESALIPIYQALSTVARLKPESITPHLESVEFDSIPEYQDYKNEYLEFFAYLGHPRTITLLDRYEDTAEAFRHGLEDLSPDLVAAYLVRSTDEDREEMFDRLDNTTIVFRRLVLDSLRDWTDSDQPDERAGALEATAALVADLGQFDGYRSTIDTFVAASADEDWNVRLAAIAGLERLATSPLIQPDEIIAHLLSRLDDPEPTVRRRVAAGVVSLAGDGHLDPSTLVTALRTRLEDALSKSRQATALGTILVLTGMARAQSVTRSAAVDAIQAGLDASEQAVRRRTIVCLADIAAVDATTISSELAEEVAMHEDDPDPVVRNAVRRCLQPEDGYERKQTLLPEQYSLEKFWSVHDL